MGGGGGGGTTTPFYSSLKRCIINIYTFLHNEQMYNTLGCLKKKVQFKSLSILSESTVTERSLQFHILVDK